MINCVIDISHHQQTVDFNKMKADGIRAVIHKATESTGYVDPKYASRKDLALSVGLLWGAYHFMRPASVSKQVQWFLDNAHADKQTLLVLDHEDPAVPLRDAIEFVLRVAVARNQFPVLYSGNLIKEQHGPERNVVLAQCPLWIARYGNEVGAVPPSWSTWTMWQYTDGVAGPTPHSVEGVGPCDRDQFNGDLAALHRLWNVAQPIQPVPEEPEEPQHAHCVTCKCFAPHCSTCRCS